MEQHKALHRAAYEEVRRQEATTPPVSIARQMDHLLSNPDTQGKWIRGLRSFILLLALQPNGRRIGRDQVDAEGLLRHWPETLEKLSTAIGIEIGPWVGGTHHNGQGYTRPYGTTS